FPLITYTDYLTPKTQYLVHDEDESFRLEKLKAAPARFDASDFEVKQHFAKSADGTEVPYFVIQKKGLILDGANPTVLYGYGGFEVSMTPYYSGVIGKAWLERGGVYVVANIRGGGEFGPSWHQAALKHHRQRAYDDFIAVAEDLIQQRITSPRHLGIQGGSNGGLLVGAVMVQRPELFGAVLCQVPLLDMVRYTKLLAGSLWIGEYGDPTNAADLAYLLTYSPYQNLRADQRYPTPLFTTSTKDDRVHPGHARKFAARMAEQGHSFYFYENINGGHAGSANLEESAHMTALEYAYLWSRLK
ncbi:MAG: S9 family peptidase, partial [Proteobacteria bacterium]